MEETKIDRETSPTAMDTDDAAVEVTMPSVDMLDFSVGKEVEPTVPETFTRPHRLSVSLPRLKAYPKLTLPLLIVGGAVEDEVKRLQKMEKEQHYSRKIERIMGAQEMCRYFPPIPTFGRNQLVSGSGLKASTPLLPIQSSI